MATWVGCTGYSGRTDYLFGDRSMYPILNAAASSGCIYFEE